MTRFHCTLSIRQSDETSTSVVMMLSAELWSKFSQPEAAYICYKHTYYSHHNTTHVTREWFRVTLSSTRSTQPTSVRFFFQSITVCRLSDVKLSVLFQNSFSICWLSFCLLNNQRMIASNYLFQHWIIAQYLVYLWHISFT